MRRILTTTLCLTILVCLTSNSAWSKGFLCSNLGILCPKTVDVDRTVERGGLTYEVNSQTPFTGYTVTKHRNGQIEKKTQYKDGKKDGLWVEYNKDGRVDTEVTYKNGKKDTSVTYSYHLNGQLESKITWKDGKKDGSWVYYDEKGP